MNMNRRNLLAGAGAAAASTLLARAAGAQSFPFSPNQRYPDPAVQILDPSFAKYRIYSSTVEQVATGMRWAEGPAYFPEGGYLLFSDIPNNRIMKFDEKTNQTSVFRANANYANGNARDRQGRLVTCEHSVTRRITRTEKDGKITVMKTPNGENPLVHGAQPILGCDVWEHSYYIDYRNRRPDYLKAFLDNLVNWEYVAEMYAKAAK